MQGTRHATFPLATLALPVALALAACVPDTPSPTEREPDPEVLPHTELRDAIREPQDRARAAEAALQKAADAQRARIDDAGG
ncbi:MAG: hypothetical protein Q4F49_01075 [Pseudoxanthomonas suwonensis]|nr:hypothetical protein [Pseudoxanthomonas suwonensis]